MRQEITGLVCDNPNCSYEQHEPVAKSLSEWDSKFGPLVNKPCPLCGENLLTGGDFESTRISYKIVDTIGLVFKPWNWLMTKLGVKEDSVTVFNKFKTLN